MRKHAKIVFKEFGSSFGRFIAIAGIIALGLAFLIGINIATPDIKKSFDDYFLQNNLYDFSLRSETGFTADDVDKISALDDVDGVESLFSYDAYCTVDGGTKKKTVRFFGTDGEPEINKLTLVDGRMPASDNEAVAVIPFGNMEPVGADNKLTVCEEDRNTTVDLGGMTIKVPLFNETTFNIVGTVTTPLYFSTNDETCTKGDGKVDYILFSEKTAFLDITTEVWVSAENPEGYAAFSENYDEYADTVSDKIGALGDKWYVLGRDTNLSYYSMSINADKVAGIAGIFPIFFIAVAALVAFSTIVRMVDEDRSQIGTLRSLGYAGSRIVGKYIFYSVAACVLGLIVAVPLGLTILPLVIWNAYGSMYALPALVLTADWLMISLSCVASIGATILVTACACRTSLKETPAQIMQPRAPKAGKRILLERFTPLWKRLPFKYKATLRNMFRFKRNFIMTVLAVAGCSALILAGFGMLNSTAAVTDLQFNQIYAFDLTLGVNQNYADVEEMKGFLGNKEYIEVLKERGSAANDGKSENVNIVAADEKLNGYIDIGGDFGKDSVMISKGLADALGIGEGDEFRVKNADGDTGIFKATNIVTMYSECWVFVGEDEYAEVFGDSGFNSLLVRSGIAEKDQSDAAEKLFGISCVTGVSFTTSEREIFDNLSETISLIVVVLIACAGALVVIVLYNLTNINIGERKKEIATLKVLGYKKGEVAGYVFREIIMLVVIGILVGIGLGYGLMYFIISSIQAPYLQFPYVIYWWSYLLTAGITLIFSGLVDLILLPKLTKIDMAESMKAVE